MESAFNTHVPASGRAPKFKCAALLALTGLAMLLGVPAAHANLLLNGNFASGTSPWTLSTSGGASATLANQSGTGKVDILLAGTSRSNIQLRQTLTYDLQATIAYTVTFQARGAASKLIDVAICDSAGSTVWSQANVSVPYTNTTFSFTYTAASNLAGAYLRFDVGGNITDIVFDNVVITPSAKLTWAPPTLSNPTTINLTATSNVGALAAGTDYIIKLPSTTRTKRVEISGGRNVQIIGGHVQLVTVNQHAFVVKNGDDNRVVHIEGCLVTTAPGAEGDAVDLNCPTSIVQVQNLRVEDITGTKDTLHGDIIQAWGGSKELRVDHLTGSSDYQGLFLIADYNRNQSFIFKNVNMLMKPEVSAGALGGDTVWLDRGLSGSKGGPVPTFFSNVYAQPRTGENLDTTVFPGPTASNVAERPVLSNGFLSWPNLVWVTGGLRQGTPPGGDFVPSGAAGIGYTSPGYLP